MKGGRLQFKNNSELIPFLSLGNGKGSCPLDNMTIATDQRQSTLNL